MRDEPRPRSARGTEPTILYASHTGVIGGGERSLLLLLAGLPPDVRPVLACPPGALADAAAATGVAIERLHGTATSLRLHPWHTTQGVADILSMALALRRMAHRHDAILVHANTIRAGLAAVLVAQTGGPPAVVHVRDCLPESRVSQIVRSTILRGAAAVIANSVYTGQAFHAREAYCVYNPVDLSRLDPNRVDGKATRRSLGLSGDDLVLAVIGQITPWKGQLDALRALARLAPRWPRLRLLVVGAPTFVARATRYDNVAYLRELQTFVKAEALERRVHFLGNRDDVPDLLAAADILLAPSWEEPFGRSIVEAMAMGVPVLATNVGGPSEIVRDCAEGLLLPPRDPPRWADAVERLLASPQERAAMGRRARRRVIETFGVAHHVRDVLAVYGAVLPRSPAAVETVRC